MVKEFEPKQFPKIEIEEPIGRMVGSTVLWANQVTDDLPFSLSTLLLMEGIQEECPSLETRIEQLECLDAIQAARVEGQERALVQMATGLGKTTVIAADVKRFLADKPKARILFLCHQNDILAQARERFETIIGLDYTYGNFTGEGEKDYHEVDCLFASFQAMREWRVAFKEDEFDYIAVDESHHGKATTYEPTLRYFKPQFMLGVTATPDRHDLRNIREIFGEEIYRLPLEEAIARGLLAEVDYHVITDEITDGNILKDLKGKRLNINQLNRTIFIPKRDEEIVRIINEKAEQFEKPKRIIFCKSIEQAEEYAQYFDRAAPLHSRLPKWEQDKYITKFKNGELDTLLPIDMFNEGMDIPEANQIVFLRSTQSKTVFLQQLGRGLRKIHNKKLVQVLDFVANCDRLTMLDDVWNEIRSYASERISGPAPETIRIDVGNIHFSEVSREILDILADIRTSVYPTWSPADSISYYRKLSDELGRPAYYGDLIEASRRKGCPPVTTVLKAFDNRVKKLRDAAGYEVKGLGYEEWGAEHYIKYYQELSAELGRPANLKDIATAARANEGPPLRKVVELFGHSITILRETAGLHWTRESSISYYKRLCENLGRLASVDDINTASRRKEGPSTGLLLRDFEHNISELRKASGFKVNRYSGWNKEDVIEYYRKLSDNLGHPASANDIAAASKRQEGPSPSTIMKIYGGLLSDLRTAADFKPIGYQHWERQDFINYYLSVTQAIGKPATKHDLEAASKANKGPSVPVILAKFEGKITVLKRAAEVKFRDFSNWTNSDYVRYYRDISEELGRPATQEDLKNASKQGRGPSETTLAEAYAGKLNNLRQAAGYTIR